MWRFWVGLSRAFALLSAGVPLTLLIDLSAPDGPDSAGILSSERGSAQRASDAA
jgi:hypothetical protein